jgi:hypothetical protein
VPLKEIGGLTIGKMKALEAGIGPVAATQTAKPAKDAAVTPSTPEAKKSAVPLPTIPAPLTPVKKRISEDSASSTPSPGTPSKVNHHCHHES